MRGKSEWRATDTAVNIACQKESIVHYNELDVLLVLLLVHFYYFLLKKNDEKDATITNLPKVLEIPAADIRKAAFCGWGDFFVRSLSFTFELSIFFCSFFFL